MNNGILVCKQLNQGKRSGRSKGAALAIGVTCLASVAVSAPAQAVVGGSNANIGDYPHMGDLRFNGSHVCGAVLINTTTALTAASCVEGPIGGYSVLFGTADRAMEQCHTCVLRNLISVIPHPGFKPGVDDIAVLHFSPISYNVNVQAIGLAQPSNGDFANQRCMITGWGEVSRGGLLPELLQQGELDVTTNVTCAEQWGGTRINSGHICSTNVTVAASYGDGGDPLECSGLLAGLVSWGSGTGSPAWPTVSTRISYYYSWIIAQ
jgi:trypsin